MDVWSGHGKSDVSGVIRAPRRKQQGNNTLVLDVSSRERLDWQKLCSREAIYWNGNFDRFSGAVFRILLDASCLNAAVASRKIESKYARA